MGGNEGGMKHGDAREKVYKKVLLTAVEDIYLKFVNILLPYSGFAQIFRSGVCEDVPLALDGILTATELHPRDNRIQISGSASLFYIVKNSLHHIGSRVKRRIIRSLLAGICD